MSVAMKQDLCRIVMLEDISEAGSVLSRYRVEGRLATPGSNWHVGGAGARLALCACRCDPSLDGGTKADIVSACGAHASKQARTDRVGIDGVRSNGGEIGD